MAGDRRRLLTPEFRMCYPKLIKAEAYAPPGKQAKGEPVFSMESIFDADKLDKFLEEQDGQLVPVDVRVIASQVAKAKWPDIASVKEVVGSGALYWPVLVGNKIIEAKEAKAAAANKEKPKLDHYKDKHVIKLSTGEDYPPPLTILEGGKVISLSRVSDVDMAKAKLAFKGGNYGMAEVVLTATESPQGRFLKFYVSSVRMTRVGEPISGGTSLLSRFDGVNGGKSAHNPMEGLDDEIPF